jgi:hypothetical protein
VPHQRIKRYLLTLLAVPLALATVTAVAPVASASCPERGDRSLNSGSPCQATSAAVTSSTVTTGVVPPTNTVVTPDQARSVLANYQTVNARANSHLNARLLPTVEAGQKLAVDREAYSVLTGEWSTYPTSPLVSSTVYVPRQRSWPAFFVAFEARTGLNDVVLFQKAKKSAPWKATDSSNSLTDLASLNIATDAAGYVSQAGNALGVIPAGQVGAATCDYANQVGTDRVLPALDGGVAAFSQQLAAARATNAAQRIKTASRCTPQPTPLVSLASPDGSWVIYSVKWTVTTTGAHKRPLTTSTVGMFATLVSADGTNPTPVTIPFATISATGVAKASKPSTAGGSAPTPAPAGQCVNATSGTPQMTSCGAIPTLWSGYPAPAPSWVQPGPPGSGNTQADTANAGQFSYFGTQVYPAWLSVDHTPGVVTTPAQLDAIPGLQICVRSVRLGTALLTDGTRVPNNVFATAPCRSGFFSGEVNHPVVNELDTPNFGTRPTTGRSWIQIPAADLASPGGAALLTDFAFAATPVGENAAQLAGELPPSITATAIANVKRAGVGPICIDITGVNHTQYTFKLDDAAKTAANNAAADATIGTTAPGGGVITSVVHGEPSFTIVDMTAYVVGLDGAHYCNSPGRIDYIAPPAHKPAASTGHHPVKPRTHKSASSNLGWLIYAFAGVVVALLVALLWVKHQRRGQVDTEGVAFNDTPENGTQSTVTSDGSPLDDANLPAGGAS